MTEPDTATQPCPSCGELMQPTDAGGLACENASCAASDTSALPPRDAREESNEPTGADDVGA